MCECADDGWASGARDDGCRAARVGGLHVVWAAGSSFPFADRAALADTVVGRDAVPGPGACAAVAAALFAASALVADVPLGRPSVRRLGGVGVAPVLGTRAGLGFAGRTDLVSSGSASPTFRRADRRLYAPLCAALAAGALASFAGRS